MACPRLVLATKVDPAPGSSDFSGARVRASFEESLERLGVDRIQLLHLHDPERISFDEGMAPGGPVEALVALRERGPRRPHRRRRRHRELMRQYVATGLFDVLLNHNRFTLLDRSADTLYGTRRTRAAWAC